MVVIRGSIIIGINICFGIEGDRIDGIYQVSFICPSMRRGTGTAIVRWGIVKV